jgi:hypothetical protein
MAQTLSMNRDISTKRVTHLVPESVRSYTRKCELHKNFFKPKPLLPLEVLRRVEERQMAKSRLGVQRCYRTKYVTVKPTITGYRDIVKSSTIVAPDVAPANPKAIIRTMQESQIGYLSFDQEWEFSGTAKWTVNFCTVPSPLSLHPGQAGSCPGNCLQLWPREVEAQNQSELHTSLLIVTAGSMQWSGLKVQRISCIENTKLESKGEGNALTFSSVLLVSSSLVPF